jgi:hypothetical protein
VLENGLRLAQTTGVNIEVVQLFAVFHDSKRVAEYRKLSYADVAARIDDEETCEFTGPSSMEYQIEIQFLGDGQPDGNIRVFGRIDDGGLRAFVPLIDDFFMSPDGQFVGG